MPLVQLELDAHALIDDFVKECNDAGVTRRCRTAACADGRQILGIGLAKPLASTAIQLPAAPLAAAVVAAAAAAAAVAAVAAVAAASAAGAVAANPACGQRGNGSHSRRSPCRRAAKLCAPRGALGQDRLRLLALGEQGIQQR